MLNNFNIFSVHLDLEECVFSLSNAFCWSIRSTGWLVGFMGYGYKGPVRNLSGHTWTEGVYSSKAKQTGQSKQGKQGLGKQARYGSYFKVNPVIDSGATYDHKSSPSSPHSTSHYRKGIHLTLWACEYSKPHDLYHKLRKNNRESSALRAVHVQEA